MASLDALVNEIAADGKVDAAEAAKLREVIYADGKVEKSEADALFKLNDKVSGGANDAAWEKLFVQAISDYILADGVVDDDEAKWLIAAIGADGKVDGAEKKLLANIKAKAKSVSPILSGKFGEFGV